ncbi:hypothetical protein BDW74DRAFT_178346 [Aspergillus multicolor]|uniref:uncharacterized protein n=1 Tax=Aspergillus multicolor TaxID=41759 RepID=UPI003CCD1813
MSTSAPTTTSLPQGPRSCSRDGHDLVGIVGMACRVPGANSVDEFWRLMKERRDLCRKMPAERFNVDGFYHPKGQNKGTLNAPYGYFLEQNLGDFDAAFFGISPKEAEAMDPQQRLALEVVYEALEDAGIPFPEIAGSRTSVYCGSFTNDYGKLIDRDMASYPTYTVTGTGQTILSNRISYFYDLHGESMTVDTACSSSLISLHLGCQSLRNGDSDMAIVVGSALHFDPNMFVTMADFGMLSPDGRSRSFDADGKGYARGEGVCVVVLKKLHDAESSNDRIHAVVRATGANHDGTKNGITLPNPVAQQALMEDVYRKAGISTKDTAYFEAHGTGTKAGDPRETRAIGAVFANDGRLEPLYVGSVKSIIGHLEGAAGLAAVIKATLSVKSGQILPNMHFLNPNPEIDFEKWNLRVPTEVLDWPSSSPWRRASINSFGYGGSNCHVVVEAYTSAPHSNDPSPDSSARRYLIPISGHSEKVGKKVALALREYFVRHPEVDMANLAYTLSQHRAHHEQRSFVTAKSAEEAAAALEDVQAPLIWNTAKSIKRLGFVFTGQGAQWARMGATLLEASAPFREAIEEYDRILQLLPDRPEWSAVDELRKSKQDSRINTPQFSQPLCTAVQLGLLAQLSEWGITPSATVGHSSGEVAAAYAAGLISFSSAVVLSYYRGKYTSHDAAKPSISNRTGPGGMLAVGMTEAEAQRALEPYQSRICVAAINSPSSLTLSGDKDAVEGLKETLTEKKVFARSLVVQQAYHSHHMLPFSDTYLQAMERCPYLEPVESSPTTVSMVSSVTGRRNDVDAVEPEYWVKNLVSPVRFSDAVTETILDDADHVQIDAFVEIGPHPALKGPVRQTLAALGLKNIPYIGTLARGLDDFQSLLGTAGQLYSFGYSLDLAKVNAFHGTSRRQRVDDLPTYPWDHSRYWAQTRLATAYLQREYRHPLLGAPQPDSTGNTKRWRNYLRLKEIPWLAGHKVQGRVIFPAAGYLSLAAEAAYRVNGIDIRSLGALKFESVHIEAALELSDNETGTEIIFELRRLTAETQWQFNLHSFDADGDSRQHCHGIVWVESEKGNASIDAAAEWNNAACRTQADERFYHNLHALGLEYDGPFKLLKGVIESAPGFATAPIAPSDNVSSADCLLDPGFLDATLHPIFAAVEAELGRPITQPFLPVYVDTLEVSSGILQKQHFNDMRVFSRVKRESDRSLVANVDVYHQTKTPLVALKGLELRALGGDLSADTQRSLFQSFRWLPCFDLLSSAGDIGNPSIPASMEGLLDAFAHQHPDASILYIVADDDALKPLLSGIGLQAGIRKRYKDITIVSQSSPALEQLDALRSQQSWSSVSLLPEIPEQRTFDLVVVCDPSAVSPNLVKTNGYIISQAGFTPQNHTMTKVLQRGQVECWQRTAASEHDRAIEHLAVVTATAPSAKTKGFINLLEQKGKTITTTTFVELDVLSLEELPETLIVLESLDEFCLHRMDTRHSTYFDGVKKLLSASSKHIIWLLEESAFEPNNPQHAIVYGMLRAARSENEFSRILCLDVQRSSEAPQILQAISPLLEAQYMDEDEVAVRDGVHYIPRIEMDDNLNGKLFNGYRRSPVQAPFRQEQALQLGSSAVFDPVTLPALGDEELEIEVKAAQFRRRDALQAQAGSANIATIGGDCVGLIVRKGDAVPDDQFHLGARVVAIRSLAGSLRNRLRIPASHCRRLQDQEHSELAVCWPTAVSMAYYALVHLARVTPGEVVLVLSAESETGRAIVQVTKHLGATPIPVANSARGQALLLNSLPGLTVVTHEELNNITDFEPVDVILSNHEIRSSWLKPCGRVIDYSDLEEHKEPGMEKDQNRGGVYARIALDSLLKHRPGLVSEVLKIAQGLVRQGVVQLAQPDLFSFSQVKDAVDHVLAPTDIDTPTVLTVADDCQVLISPPSFGSTSILFSSDKVYLIVGGLSGLGLELAEWMVLRGARQLAFMSRSGAGNAAATDLLARLATKGVLATVYRCDVTDFAAVEQCIKQIGSQLGGIFHAAAVIDDCPLQQMSLSQWCRTVAPKVQGADNLDRATRDMHLDFFVCFSSASALVGTKAQASYVAGNAYMDALMCNRRQRGLSGTTINIGMVVGIGLVSADANLEAMMKRTGFDPVNEYEFFCLVEEAIRTGRELTTSGPRNEESYRIVTGTRVTSQQCFWYKKPLFRQLAAVWDAEEEEGGVPAATGQKKTNLVPLLRAASDGKARLELVMSAFLENLAKITGVAIDNLIPDKALVSYGLDSLVAMEIRTWFFKTLQVNVAVFEILGSESIVSLVSQVVKDIPASLLRAEGSSEKAPTPTSKEHSQRAVIGKVPRPKQIPMSSYQTRFWFMHQMAEDKSALNITITLHLRGQLDTDALLTAFACIRQRNEVLRTAFVMGDRFPEQVLVDRDHYDVSMEDLSSTESPEQAISSRILQLRRQELDIESGETVSISLLKVDYSQYALVLIVHHIITDRGSSKAFLDQLVACYDDVVTNKSVDVSRSDRKTQYIDFTLWHDQHLRSPEMKPHIDYWVNVFKEAPPVSAVLPFARPRPQVQSFKTSSLAADFPSSTFTRLKRIAARFNSTVPQYILAVFRLIHYRYTQQEDLTIHLVQGDRPHPDVQDMLGSFVNLLPIRHRLESADVTFDVFLSQMQRKVSEAMEHGRVPFDVIVREAAVARTSSHFPLGQLTFNYQSHGQMKDYRTNDFEIQRYETVDIPTACDMSLEAIENTEGGLRFNLEYSQVLYDAGNMDLFLDNFLACLSATCKDYRQPIDGIPICGPKETALLMKQVTPVHHATSEVDIDIARAIDQQAALQPSAVALLDSDGRSVTYSELVDAARKCAAAIQSCGAKPGDFVGLLAAPSVDMLVGMLGIIFSRCAFVALDPEFPEERLQYMATDSGCTVVLTDSGVHGFSQTIVNIKQAASQPTVSLLSLRGFDKDQPFYVTYTSGSTGKPKGVVMRHRNAQPMLQDIQDEFHFDSHERFLLATSICFDLSIVQIFTPLLVGATVCISSATVRRDPLLLAQFMKQSSVSFTYFTPSQFAVLIEGAEDELRECATWKTAFFCGEVLHSRLARQLYSMQTPAVVYNVYGPCEAMVQITLEQVNKPVADDQPISIGRPLRRSWCYVVDAGLNLLPAGVSGELCVGGPQVGEAYINRPKESRKAFKLDPFIHQPSESHIFRTGDMAQLNRDGTIEYMGRIAGTTQVKLRGYRLDLLDIEHNILVEAGISGFKEVSAASVVARTVNANSSTTHTLADERQLIAFVVLRDPRAQPDEVISRLHHGLSKRLTQFMLPGGYHVLDSLPQTIGGKTDRQKLLTMPLDLIYPQRPRAWKIDEEEINAKVVFNWVMDQFRTSLNLQPARSHLLDPDTSFFNLGGHSVLLLSVQSAINRKFKVKIPLKDILDRPTARGVAERICALKGITLPLPGSNSSSTGASTPLTPGSLTDEDPIRIVSGDASPHTPLTPPMEIEDTQFGKEVKDRLSKITNVDYQIDWEEETLLPVEDRYHISAGAQIPSQQETTDIFITGVDSFVGIHFLAEVLARSAVTVHVIGTSSRISHASILEHLRKYNLLHGAVSAGTIWARVRCYHGDMTRPRFGMSPSDFHRLGARVQAIYNLGVYVSLIQKYSSLRTVNTRAILDIIELAACGPQISTIHHLSTFSVPHLQSWTNSVRMQGSSYATAESAPSHYRPSSSDDHGYIKARWAAEMLLANAADRGFPTRIYRSSMPTASTATAIPPPDSGVIERLVTLMLQSGLVPRPQPGKPDMAVDLVPVDVLASWLHSLSTSAVNSQSETDADQLQILHITNPHPLPFSQLTEIVPMLSANSPRRGELLDHETWLERLGKHCGASASESDRLIWVAITSLLKEGHVMFPLDGKRTQAALRKVALQAQGPVLDCPPVDAEYLRLLLDSRG